MGGWKDALSDLAKKVSPGPSSGPGTFEKGKGRVLGGAPVDQVASAEARAAARQAEADRRQAGPGSASRTPPAPRPARRLGIPDDPPVPPRPAARSSPALAPARALAPPAAPAAPLTAGVVPPPEHVLSALETAVVSLSSAEQAAASAALLRRIFGNVAASPSEAGFRRVRLDGAKTRGLLGGQPAALELLWLSGWEPEEGDGDGRFARLPPEAELGPLAAALDLLAQLPEDGRRGGAGGGGATVPSAPPPPREAGLAEGAPLPPRARDAPGAPSPTAPAPAPSPAASAPAPVPSPAASAPAPVPSPAASAPAPVPSPRTPAPVPPPAPPPRNTRVVLPASIDHDVPAWFFERTGKELMASFRAEARRREQDGVLMTRAMRERLRGGARPPAPAPTTATVRVRLPEGLLLEGTFGASEPVSAVFLWLVDALADPMSTFDLIGPDRKPLEGGPAGRRTVKAAGLLPSAVLNLAWTGESRVEMAGKVALRRELLDGARG